MHRLALIGSAMALLSVPAHAAPADGELVISKPCERHAQTYDEYVVAAHKEYDEEVAQAAKFGFAQPPANTLSAALMTPSEYEALRARPSGCRFVLYGSDGLRVAAYIWEPSHIPAGMKLPVVVNLRGGSEDLGKFTADNLRSVPPLVAAGFIVIGVQYRGVDGGEGVEQLGGEDVDDVVNAVALARRLPEADPRNVFLEGASRGGMMVYLAVRRGARVNAAATLSGLTDLELEAKRRPQVEANIWRKLIPNYEANRAQALASRSGVLAAREVDLPPLLILHGTADWRVDPRNSYEVAEALQARRRPYELHIFDNDVHGLAFHWRERDRLIVAWFRKHIVP